MTSDFSHNLHELRISSIHLGWCHAMEEFKDVLNIVVDEDNKEILGQIWTCIEEMWNRYVNNETLLAEDVFNRLTEMDDAEEEEEEEWDEPP